MIEDWEPRAEGEVAAEGGLVELARRLEVGARTVQKWALEEGFPGPVGRSGKANQFKWEEVKAWVKEKKGIE